MNAIFMTYREALDWLYGLQVHGIKLGLENMLRLCTALGIETAAKPDRKIIHVAGTNGKGSVCAMAAAISTASGQRTALYTSPHLVSFRERIRLGLNLIPEEHVADGLMGIRRLTEGWDHSPTFFEVTTALALSWFQEQGAKYVILETGLGGRLDATNVITPSASVITSIGLDHTKYLGDTLKAVATEKAGIIKPGVPVLTCPQPPEVEEVLRETAKRLGSPLTVVSKPVPDTWDLNLTGKHQRWNAQLAFASLIASGLRPIPRDIAHALRTVEWPGRFQFVADERVILDGAHNPDASKRLVQTWQERLPGERCTLIVGVLADKDVRGVLEPLMGIAIRVVCVPVRNPRTLGTVELSEIVEDLAPDLPCKEKSDFAAALSDALRYPERVLVAGSLFLVGEALAHFDLADGVQEFSAQ